MEEESNKVERFIQDKIASLIMKENVQTNIFKANDNKHEP